DRLMQELWSDSFVEESNIAQNVAVLRKALGEKSKENKFIVTIPGRGYRFVADVTCSNGRSGSNVAPTNERKWDSPSGAHALTLVRSAGNAQLALAPEDFDHEEPAPAVSVSANIGDPSNETESAVAVPVRSRPLLPYAVAAVIIAIIGALGSYIYFGLTTSGAGNSIAKIAVLPLKPLDASDNYLGLGMADAIIGRISQTGTVTVRPTSSIRRYLNEDKDALTAARELGVDAVLDGTIQRSGDRLRVSVNLLCVNDGRSLWADNFDMSASDVFSIEDTVARQVAASLKLRLDPVQRERLTTQYTPNPIAYEYYLKGVYSFDQRGFGLESKPQHEATIELFKKSIETDPNYAVAHALLAYAYAWMAVYVDEKAQDEWVERAKDEISRANILDPQLPETHIARHHVLLSAHEGFQTEAAAHELILAKKLNPNVAGIDLAVAYNHLGLEDLFDREMQRTLEIDPTSEFNKRIFGYQLMYAKRYDDWLAYNQKYLDGKPNVLYLLGNGRTDEAQQLAEQPPTDDHMYAENGPAYKPFLLALRGERRAAEAEIPGMISKLPYKNNSYHHGTYNIACVYALTGNSAEAVRWLRETVATGFLNYPMFERDHYLDRIRQTPEFVQFMAEMKAQNDRLRRQFAE
ncbi:MAG TPA: winged helix-turn-helix domain-containing protein, partial [Pyrinomonadaceae bacterium]|nr:winged helix-turn-helix domain-containing protein [Pyrinomonadaceae bacterium]